MLSLFSRGFRPVAFFAGAGSADSLAVEGGLDAARVLVVRAGAGALAAAAAATFVREEARVAVGLLAIAVR